MMRKRLIGILCALWLVFSPMMASEAKCAVDANDALGTLKTATANIRTLRCEFTQATDIPLFATPVESKGRLLYATPHSLIWEYTSPMQQGFVLAGETGFRWEGDRTHRTAFSTAKDPIAGLVATQMLAWVKFDRAWIEKNYTVTVTQKSPVSLRLVPKQPQVASVVSSLQITFAKDGVARSIHLKEVSGGETRITLHGIVLNGSVDAGEFR